MSNANLLVIEANRVHSMSMLDPVRQDLTWREAADLPKPTTVLDVIAALDNEPSTSDVLGDVIENLDSFEPEWLEDQLARYQRATNVERMRAALDQAGRVSAGHRRLSDAPERFGVLAGPVADALARLAVVAKALPEGAAALRPEASIDAGTTGELGEARDLLRRIGRMLGSLPMEGGHRLINRWALALLDVPPVEPARLKRFGAPILNPSADREAIKEAAKYDDTDLLVIDVLRGMYPALSLRLVASRGDVADRVERVHAAHLVITQERG